MQIVGGDIPTVNWEEEDEGLGSLITPRPSMFAAAMEYTVTVKVVAANHSCTNQQVR